MAGRRVGAEPGPEVERGSGGGGGWRLGPEYKDHHDSSETLQVVLSCSVCNLSLSEEEHWCHSSGV